MPVLFLALSALCQKVLAPLNVPLSLNLLNPIEDQNVTVLNLIMGIVLVSLIGFVLSYHVVHRIKADNGTPSNSRDIIPTPVSHNPNIIHYSGSCKKMRRISPFLFALLAKIAIACYALRIRALWKIDIFSYVMTNFQRLKPNFLPFRMRKLYIRLKLNAYKILENVTSAVYLRLSNFTVNHS